MSPLLLLMGILYKKGPPYISEQNKPLYIF